MSIPYTTRRALLRPSIRRFVCNMRVHAVLPAHFGGVGSVAFPLVLPDGGGVAFVPAVEKERCEGEEGEEGDAADDYARYRAAGESAAAGSGSGG